MSARLLLVPAVLVALMTAAGCGDDDDDDGNGAGGGGGTGGGTQCKGVYADRTQEELAAATASGQCSQSSDVLAVCANDINTEAGSCGLSCFAQGGDEATQQQCNLDCVKAATDPDPSDTCIDCYLASVACARENCLEDCLSGSTTPACVQCRLDEGCTADFYDCSGLPLPTGVSLGGTGGSDGGGGAGGA